MIEKVWGSCVLEVGPFPCDCVIIANIILHLHKMEDGGTSSLRITIGSSLHIVLWQFFVTRILGRYAPFILAPAEGSAARKQGLVSLANPTD